MKLENKEKVRLITMYPVAHTLCAIGQDFYKYEFKIDFVVGRYYPDYMDVEKWVMNNLDGKELNIEQGMRLFYDWLVESYEPLDLTMLATVKDAKTHFAVEVVLDDELSRCTYGSASCSCGGHN
jgi:hypothetical protein